MGNPIFISHSSIDKPLVEKLAERLKKDSVWFDLWNMDLGDTLVEKIEKGIDSAKIFLVVLSRNSIESKWVKYELNMALIKFIEDGNYRIVIVKIDDVEVPLRLKQFLRLEIDSSSANPAAEIASKIAELDITTAVINKRQFVNRANEITSLQDMFYNEETKFISIVGFYGIGKTSLIKEALVRIFTKPFIVEMILSTAHFGARLTLDLCAKAGLPIPVDGSSQAELDNLNILSIEKLLSKGAFIIFNRFDEVLDDSGTPHPDFLKIFTYFEKVPVLSQSPFITLSRRWPEFQDAFKNNIGYLRLKGVSDKHLIHILKAEVHRIDPNFNVNENDLLDLGQKLHGYPLAGKLAAPMLVKYSAEYLLNNLHIIQQLRVDIAEDIIARLTLTTEELTILEILAIFESPLESFYVGSVSNISSEELIKHIDNLVNLNLIETIGNGLILHPLINDFYLKLASVSSFYKEIVEKLTVISLNNLKTLPSDDPKYVFWLTKSCRLLFYSGKYQEGQLLRRDLIGELKNAAIQLYQRQEYASSLEFCNEYLESDPYDKAIIFTKARALSRLGKLNESVQILKKMIITETRDNLISKFNYGIGRGYVENSQNSGVNIDEAIPYFLESIRINDHPTALQSMAELLFRQGKYEEAESFIERKLRVTPADPFGLSIYADILWKLGKRPEALGKIIEALRHQPKNSNFLFRAGRFLYDSNRLEDAYSYIKAALNNDETYLDARLSLADICLDLDKIEEATQHIRFLEDKIKGDKKAILDSINANLKLKQNKIDDAESIASKLISGNRNIVHIGLMAKIYMIRHIELKNKGLSMMAETFKSKAIELIDEGLKIEENNERLINMKERLKGT